MRAHQSLDWSDFASDLLEDNVGRNRVYVKSVAEVLYLICINARD